MKDEIKMDFPRQEEKDQEPAFLIYLVVNESNKVIGIIHGKELDMVYFDDVEAEEEPFELDIHRIITNIILFLIFLILLFATY